MRSALMPLLLAGCTGNGDVVGPFHGTLHRYVVDRFVLPTNYYDPLGDDFGGGVVVDSAGLTVEWLQQGNDVTTHGPDMIASGAIASSVVVQAQSLVDDDRVGVTFFGADGETSTVMGGEFVAGVFSSNRTRTTHVPGAATVHLPILVDTDPSILDVEGMEIDLEADGSGGYNAVIRGGISNYTAAAVSGLFQMIIFDPASHVLDMRLFRNSQNNLTTDSIAQAPILGSVLHPDLTISSQLALSLGFGAHLAPCASGNCQTSVILDHCHDRVVDADETDVDCGGVTCQPCRGVLACQVGSDCESRTCDSGHCRAPTCSDGVRDGLESDVDCGSTCPPCGTGRACFADQDCASGVCNDGTVVPVTSVGTCS